MTTPRVLFWHRRDLRLADNLGLAAAAEISPALTGVYVLDPNVIDPPEQLPPMAPARLWFLIESLIELQQRWREAGSRLLILGGDPVKGKIHYQTCIACHQVDGKGNKILNSPSLLGHSDLYIYNQLIKFRNGQRGNGSGDKAGKIMQMSAKSLPDDQAIKDLAAYLTTLK